LNPQSLSSLTHSLLFSSCCVPLTRLLQLLWSRRQGDFISISHIVIAQIRFVWKCPVKTPKTRNLKENNQTVEFFHRFERETFTVNGLSLVRRTILRITHSIVNEKEEKKTPKRGIEHEQQQRLRSGRPTLFLPESSF
jgi:hypothetical protein